ncbi:hypothetical protein GQ53DRAFT_788236 [Thozetella sp. PMI_491]|nr:hypothetical protein GQ53DRAFT_788236 [Thozetella sp. PMI_491]
MRCWTSTQPSSWSILAALLEPRARHTKTCPPPTEAETKERFDKFANAFLVTKNITEAFEYISDGYINHRAPKNGAGPAWDFLSPIWANQTIEVLGTTFKGEMGWLHYKSGYGEIVDRYRWEGGCIAEHWDQGEKYPSN